MKKADKEVLLAAINAAILALDDWANMYAEEFCNEAKVAESKVRLNEYGTVWYIASTVQTLVKAKELLK